MLVVSVGTATGLALRTEPVAPIEASRPMPVVHEILTPDDAAARP